MRLSAEFRPLKQDCTDPASEPAPKITPCPSEGLAPLDALARQRVLRLYRASADQGLALSDEDFIGHGLDHSCRQHSDQPQKGNNAMLILTRLQVIEDTHFNHTVAGADMVGTNTLPQSQSRRQFMGGER